MIKDLPFEQIVESMKTHPEMWANFVMIQDRLVDEMDTHLLDCRARLEYLLKDPGEQDH